jgi:hypothetical protein
MRAEDGLSMVRRLTSLTGGLAVLLALVAGPAARADGPPAGLPRYDVDVVLDVAKHVARVRERVTWTNRQSRPACELVFNAHAAYAIPDGQVGLLAKMVEILRMAPSEALSFDGPALQVEQAAVCSYDSPIARVKGGDSARREKAIANYTFSTDNPTALSIPLDRPVEPGESVTVELSFAVKLPQTKGRWGQWDGITTLAQWLPVVAVHDESGWQPAPFIPWHQPFHNEAGHYTVRVKLPSDHKLAASAAEKSVRDLGDGWKEIEFEPTCVREFALIASARFREWWGEADGVKVRCLALPEHEFYAKVLLDAACEAIPVYNHWFGRYPYPQFTIVEACFGWNGNECGGLVMIDSRVFELPHAAVNFVDSLLSHEVCHQWWYNVVGTNGYAETWMDEGPATYFSHRLADAKLGKNNKILQYPRGLGWLPNIRRDDLRNYGMVGARARGEAHPTVQEMDKYQHLPNLTAATYDRGSKVFGMIEERLGETAFFEFMRHVYAKYRYRILRVADFQRELEVLTGHSWEDFFRHWVYEAGMCDWSVERVDVGDGPAWQNVFKLKKHGDGPVKVVVHLKQQGGFNEPTTLGIRLEPGDGYQMRVPIYADIPVLHFEGMNVTVECQQTGEPGSKAGQQANVRVELLLPRPPLQVTVDPDHVLLDQRPTNNQWKQHVRWRLTPLYTQLDDVDVANAYDCWNVNVGPWLFYAPYYDPWYSRGAQAGLRVGLYRTAEFYGGAYATYRANDRNIIAGVDALWDHFPLPRTQVGLNIERSLATIGPEDIPYSRGVVYGRYVLMYGSSLYLPPFEYVEAFAVDQNRGLPDPRRDVPGTELFRERPGLGVHYHKNLLTPYWNPEGGYAFDMTYQYGLPLFGNQHTFQEVFGQFSFVKSMPRVNDWLGDGPLVDWVNATRWAFRLFGGAAVPSRGQFFALGGGDRFRGFDLGERQGSLVWTGSVEWRIPVAHGLNCDVLDHVAGVRNVYVAPFYDIGDAYVKGQALGSVAHAVGAGLRVDVVWLGLIERTTLRLDVAKTINSEAPVQFWFGLQHPF